MRSLFRSFILAIGVILAVSAAADTRYRIVDLGAFPDGQYFYFPSRISDRTEILGLAYGFWPSPNRAFLWQSETGLVNLPPLPGQGEPHAGGISPQGTIVGSCGVGFFDQRATVWDKDHNPSLLGDTPFFSSYAGDIAPDGTIVGEFDFQPVIWAPDGSMSVLPTPNPDFPFGAADRINRAGDILGYTYDFDTFAQINQLWNKRGIPTAIESPHADQTITSSLNDHGQVIGRQIISSNVWPYTSSTRAFVWSRETGFQYLPGYGPPGFGVPETTLPNGINNRGQIVGSAIPQFHSFTSAVIWENGEIKDLNTMIGPYNGWFLSTADAINDRGEITGFANQFINGQFSYRAYLLVPVR